jgi:fibro-slime domain-containing protein
VRIHRRAGIDLVHLRIVVQADRCLEELDLKARARWLLLLFFAPWAACGSRTALPVDEPDLCLNEGQITTCRTVCGEGVRACIGGHLEPCRVAPVVESCSNACGEGQMRCADGAWSLCEVPVATRACANDCGPGTETCSNGVWSVCEVPIATRSCSTICGQGNEICTAGMWQPCDAPRPGPPKLRTTIRDFQGAPGHPDFERDLPGGLDLGIVQPMLGADEKPVYAGNPLFGTLTTSGRASFDQWYRDTPGVNLATDNTISLIPSPANANIFVYDNDQFFPIDNALFGNQGRAHNYHFTLELATLFRYSGGETFRFSGDDDLWVFINGRLAIDLGGFHTAMSALVDLDTNRALFGIARGNIYPFHLFFAERHTVASTLHIETSIVELGSCD